MSIMCNYCPWHDCHYASKDCPVCLRVLLDRSSSPAPSPSQANTSPPNRTSNAASANGAASLLERIQFHLAQPQTPLTTRWEKSISFERDELLNLERILSDAVASLDTAKQRIEVSSRERPAQYCKAGEDYQRAESVSARYERMAEGKQITGADIKLGLTSSPTRDRSSVGESAGLISQRPVVQVHPIAPLPEPAIRAAVYGCTDAQCVCGRCAPVRLAIDPWQGLGKTWSDK